MTPDEVYAQIAALYGEPEPITAPAITAYRQREALLWHELAVAAVRTPDAPLWARSAVALLAKRMRQEAGR